MLLKSFIIGFTFVLLSGAVMLSPVVAQVETEGNKDIYESSKRDYESSRIAQEAAEEYYDIMVQLQETIEDYQEYYADMEPSERRMHPLNFDLFKRGLKSGKYAKSSKLLLRDLRTFIAQLKEVEREHLGGIGKQSAQCCRYVRNLRREMIVIEDLVVEYESKGQDGIGWGKTNKIDLSDAMKKLAKALENITIDESRLNKIFQEMAEKHARGGKSDRFPFQPIPPEITGLTNSESKSRVTTAKMTADDPDKQVVIESPYGDIEIHGWDEDLISAELSISVSSQNSKKGDQYLTKTGIEVRRSQDSYLLKVNMPRISGSEMEVMNSVLTVLVPENNSLKCESRFGRIIVAEISAPVQVEGKHLDIDLSDIRGSVVVRNSDGPIALADIKGDIDIENAYGPIRVENSKGTFRLSNSYDLIQLENNSGKVDIYNSGFVTIAEHSGNVRIANSYGLTNVESIEGNLEITTAYQPVTISNVNGRVNARNSHSNISLTSIKGPVTANTVRGQITAQDLFGPLEFTSIRGNIILELSEQLEGSSNINITYGTATFNIDPDIDMFFQAETTNGEINSLLPLSIIRDGLVVKTKHLFGRAKDSLNIDGKNANIIISGID